MKWFRLICLAAMAGQYVGSAAAPDGATAKPEADGSTAKTPPVLRPLEPPENWQITLPTPAPAAPAVKQAFPAPAAPVVKKTAPARSVTPVTKLAPAAKKPVEDAAPAQLAPAQPATVPVVAPAAVPLKAAPLLDVGRELAAYCQKQIGHWKEGDARKLLGEPKRHRLAYDEKKAVNGNIYAFTDPTNKYKEVELDFDLNTGFLRTVFVYPPRLTWQECRRMWNGPVAAADAARGRKFYSYTNRRLDVLVDPAGKVISLGWY